MAHPELGFPPSEAERGFAPSHQNPQQLRQQRLKPATTVSRLFAHRLFPLADSSEPAPRRTRPHKAEVKSVCRPAGPQEAGATHAGRHTSHTVRYRLLPREVRIQAGSHPGSRTKQKEALEPERWA